MNYLLVFLLFFVYQECSCNKPVIYKIENYEVNDSDRHVIIKRSLDEGVSNENTNILTSIPKQEPVNVNTETTTKIPISITTSTTTTTNEPSTTNAPTKIISPAITTKTTIITTTSKETTITSGTNPMTPGIQEVENTQIEAESFIQVHQEYYTYRKARAEERIDIFNKVKLFEISEHQHDDLSSTYRTAIIKKIPFNFPFYGHNLKQVTIAIGGFLYMSEYIHSFLTITQYIAPLMANFDTSIDEKSKVFIYSNDTSIIVQWKDVHLNHNVTENPNLSSLDCLKNDNLLLDVRFSFFVVLRDTGQLIFGYNKIGMSIDLIDTSEHPVKIGVSDAYYMKRQTGYGHYYKEIYEYHRIEIPIANVNEGDIIFVDPLPTCILQKNCEDCISNVKKFNCTWCAETEHCSDGIDRKRQYWHDSKCHLQNITTNSECVISENERRENDKQLENPPIVRGLSAIGLFFVLLLCISLVGSGGWFIYAYRNPDTTSGRWLIDNHPRNWKLNLCHREYWRNKFGKRSNNYQITTEPHEPSDIQMSIST
ncbi:Plexin domain-containing protein 1 [Intoshia linei]|uniref:Plexin domain-containing protein 1 n=1 Tax=Intoshia linei TaxID=1819745 RepID=A0A177B4D7_9BILA|nr:Plexin domain-containing protein 1 [Intoshia linei]